MIRGIGPAKSENPSTGLEDTELGRQGLTDRRQVERESWQRDGTSRRNVVRTFTRGTDGSYAGTNMFRRKKQLESEPVPVLEDFESDASSTPTLAL